MSATQRSPLQRAEAGRQAISADFGHDDWVEEIDLDTLDVWNLELCPLGQVYGLSYSSDEGANPYLSILDRLSDEERGDDEISMGFNAVNTGDANAMNEAWRIVIGALL